MAFCRAMLEVEIRIGWKGLPWSVRKRCVAQGDGTVQQGVQHQVAESDLLGPLRHTLSREQVVKNVVDHIVGSFPVIFGVHPNHSP